MLYTRYLIKEEEDEIIKQYLAGIPSTKIILSNRPISFVSICKVLKRRGIKVRSASINKRTYTTNDTFFDTIDTEEKAYILGFLWADGNNVNDRIRLLLKESDIEILNRINKIIQPSKPLRVYINKNNYKSISMCIENKHMSQILNSMGMIPNKTFTIKFPNKRLLPTGLRRHFIRGYFDGDGSFTNGMFNITGNKYMIKSIGYLLKLNCKLDKIRIYPYKNSWALYCGRRYQLRRIYAYLYEDSSISLKRKQKRFKDYIK